MTMERNGKTYDCTEEEMDNVMQLSPEALAMLKADEDGTEPLDPRTALSLAVMLELGGECTGWVLEQSCDELVAIFGSDAAALKAIRDGKVRPALKHVDE